MSRTEEQIKAEKQALENELAELRESEVRALRDSIQSMADKRGVTFDAFVQQHLGNAPRTARPNAPKRGVAPAKYASPNDSSMTWSGKGPQPGWFSAALKSGFSEQDLLIHNGYANGAHA